MGHRRRYALYLVALLVVGGLAAACRARSAPSPAAPPTQAALQAVAGATTMTATAGATPSTTASVPATLTPVPASATPTHTPLPAPSNTASATATPLPSATRVPPTPTATHTALPAPAPTAMPTALPPVPAPSAYRFLPAGPARPDPSHPCPGCPFAPAYIIGRVVDAAGSPLSGVRLACYNDWYRYPVVASKEGGEYDVALTQGETTWFVVIVDQAGEPISPEVAVPFDPGEACRYILDWRRVD